MKSNGDYSILNPRNDGKFLWFMKNVVAILVVMLVSGCGNSGSSSSNNASRPYYLGFTPFPYAVSSEAIDFSYNEITNNADLVAHHLEEGVPWDELDLNQGIENFPAELKDGWALRKARSPAGHASYVAISPISLLRDGIAPRPESVGGGLPGWLTAFNLARTKNAFLKYAVEAIEYFDPDYLVIGIEVNELMYNHPTLWPDYLELHRDTYNSLKALYPNLSISVSLIGLNLVPGYTGATATNDKYNEQLSALGEVMVYSDLYCLSLHTFLSALLADSVIDSGELEQLASLSDKPLAVCETSYPAEVFSLGALTWNGDPTRQKRFFDRLFAVADDHEAEFIVNFVIRDYDNLWASLGSPEDFNKLWRDTGFYDEDGNARPVLDTWTDELDKRRR